MVKPLVLLLTLLFQLLNNGISHAQHLQQLEKVSYCDRLLIDIQILDDSLGRLAFPNASTDEADRKLEVKRQELLQLKGLIAKAIVKINNIQKMRNATCESGQLDLEQLLKQIAKKKEISGL